MLDISTIIILFVLSFTIPYILAKAILYLLYPRTKTREQVLWFEKDGNGTPRMTEKEENK